MKGEKNNLERIRQIVEPPQQPPIATVIRPFQNFLEAEQAGGVLLIVCTVIALVWANSPWSEDYVALWETHLRIGFPGFELDKSLHHWINDGLMAIFFFFVGLEIKREILVGELASVRKAALPIAAAIGGMLVPAAIYAALNAGGSGASGWGIPMATDIAFALGILGLLGNRIPLGLTVFLAALAIVDDLGAVIVIAIFYSTQLSWASLAIAGVFLVLLVIANRLGIRSPVVYSILGFVVWFAILKSGVHATVAGVLCAMTIPTRTSIDQVGFLRRARLLLDEAQKTCECEDESKQSDDFDAAVNALEVSCEQVQTPLGRLEHGLYPWVSFLIMPIFALANAGVILSGDLGAAFGDSITLGIVLGLVIGKQAGITLFSWLAVKLGWAQLPNGAGWRHIYGAAWLGGIGFTMSLFIAGLAFPTNDLLSLSKIGILAASLVAGVIGWLILKGATQRGTSDESGVRHRKEESIA
jgi:NhaA family Na+:H+ antiporter